MIGKILKSDDLSWKIESEIGEGGFGKVYKAKSVQNGDKVAVKLVPKNNGARRELLFEDLSGAVNIVKIIATGEYEDRYFIVMDLADDSLRQKMQTSGVSHNDLLTVLRDIALALDSIRDTVVHRDIKPDNILSTNNTWALSDFGIARFIDQSTATETFKRAHSAPYTAPERWRGERASPASDVYSLGITAYEILEGRRPFDGVIDLGDAHQNAPIPAFSKGVDHRLARLVSDMLAKSAQIRPTPKRILEVVESIEDVGESPISDELLALQNASKILSSQRQEQEAEAEQRRLEIIARTNFIAESKAKLAEQLQALKDTLISNAAEGKVVKDSSTVFFAGGSDWNFQLGSAEIVIEDVSGMDASPFDGTAGLPFDVSAFSRIRLSIDGNVVRSHSVWFSDMLHEGDYGCYEVSFMEMFSSNHNHSPFALSPTDSGTDSVFRPVIGGYQLARNPLRIEDNIELFVSRWVKYLVDVFNGEYNRPSSMPEERLTVETRR